LVLFEWQRGLPSAACAASSSSWSHFENRQAAVAVAAAAVIARNRKRLLAASNRKRLLELLGGFAVDLAARKLGRKRRCVGRLSQPCGLNKMGQRRLQPHHQKRAFFCLASCSAMVGALSAVMPPSRGKVNPAVGRTIADIAPRIERLSQGAR